ncbi:MAG TPA: transferrin receptor-like dimerization domain-containing protein [Steroidobacteraceae bacterium]|jgi:N-acetylated-alpha-linked acidic dipeptidase
MVRATAATAGALIGAVLIGAALNISTAEPATEGSMLGFSAIDALQEQQLEQRFDAALSPADMQAWMRSMSSAPNHVGSVHDHANAEQILHLFQSWGWQASIETFEVLYPTPRHIALRLLSPTKFSARLHEPAIPGDATPADATYPGGERALPPYNVYGADGDVSGQLVYVNHGMPEDYEELDRRGISVKDRIVIARYRGGWRGLKPKLAYEHGAVGCVIYSDPRDDGYFPGDVYPQGGWRPPDGVQRGSVEDMPLYPGDPLTPGEGATRDAHRLSREAAQSLAKIPVLPVSYADARPLLAALGGPVAPPSWRGALDITYHIGPGAARVRLQVQSDWRMKPIYDVIARIAGSELPDEWVLRGNHHDAWVFGAWDPLSGHSAMLAEAKALGQLLQSGWRPRRTLVYASWDGEEPGLLGSTEWAESHAQELREHAVAYLNSDENERGFLAVGGSHSLQRLVTEVSAGVHDPQTDGSVQARLRAHLRVEAFQNPNASDRARRLAQAAADGADLPLEPLGSGSDFSAFLQHLGIASLNVQYVGEGEQQGVYHSAYDTFDHYAKFGDPGFQYELAQAQTVGHLALRLADADALPLQAGDLAGEVESYLQELHKLASDEAEHAQALADLRRSRAFELASDPRHPLGPPSPEGEVPMLDFAPLDTAATQLQHCAEAYDSVLAEASVPGLSLDAAQRAQLDVLLQGLEQTLLIDAGLPRRPWYKHLMYAPGALTGYEAKTVPGVREAIENHRWQEAQQYIGLTAQALGRYCERLDSASALLRQ